MTAVALLVAPVQHFRVLPICGPTQRSSGRAGAGLLARLRQWLRAG